jgi:hypothetical protein
MTAHYNALCRGYRLAGAELVSFASHTGKAVHRRVRSCDDQEHTLLGGGGSGRSFVTAGNGAELVSCASHSGSGVIHPKDALLL